MRKEFSFLRRTGQCSGAFGGTFRGFGACDALCSAIMVEDITY